MPQRTFDVTTPDGPMPVYEATPETVPANGKAVIVVQEAFGVNDHIQDVTRRVAAAGYHAMAPHLFHRTGGGTAPYGDMQAVGRFFAGISDDTLMADVDATLGVLHEAGFTDPSIGIIGFCMGGRVTFLVATQRALGAGVGFYGGGIVTSRFPVMPPLIDRATKLQTPWLGIFGDQDAGIPVDDVERLRRELTLDARVPTDVVRYPDAGHGFHCDARPDFHEESARDAWLRATAWLDLYLS